VKLSRRSGSVGDMFDESIVVCTGGRVVARAAGKQVTQCVTILTICYNVATWIVGPV
jgi:hypothetical protein